ncbi:MAG: DUF2778 domain-containing protein [Bradyrhizobium sp.]|uniref:DUF2778 domain-containing protein n=1 Tax=Bradyrhizobium sp. TaxID=376 RepID=UPI002724193D|nr:tlde1 domain-containing protein [Bradyrhizobium sp.]MDO8398002.1 DUF2778 domain-containing protein [Bradyrhizobium sp.]
MSYSTSASRPFAAKNHRRSSRKANANHIFGSAAVACLVLGCAWTVYTNVFGASIYPTLASGNFDAPVIRHKQSVAARTPQAIVNTVFAALPEPAPIIAAPATIASASTLRFEDRFAAAAPQGVEPKPQAATIQLASASPSVEVAKPADAPKLFEAAKPKQASQAPVQVAALTPTSAETKPAKATGVSIKDMAQRAKAAVMAIAEKPNMVEKLWGKEPASRSLLSYASADVSATGSLPKLQNPMLGGSAPYDRSTAVYDIAARKVYLPDGTVLEAHSGLGAKKDDVRYAHVRMQGVTPPHIYDLTPREALFHGVPALRLTPIGGQDKIFNRDGLLAHTYMLGSGGDSNGCISFKDYYAFLDAYRKGGIKRIAVVARVE